MNLLFKHFYSLIDNFNSRRRPLFYLHSYGYLLVFSFLTFVLIEGITSTAGDTSYYTNVSSPSSGSAAPAFVNSSCNVLSNHELDAGTDPWFLYLEPGPNAATYTIDNTGQLSGANSAHINISSTSGISSDIKFGQDSLDIYQGEQYAYAFSAKASINRSIEVSIHDSEAPYTVYSTQLINLTTSATDYGPFSFFAPASDLTATIVFSLGSVTGDVFLDDIEFYHSSCDHIISGRVFNDIDKDGILDSGEPIQSGTSIKFFKDNNQDGAYDAADTYLASTLTDANGIYFLPVFPGTNQYISQQIDDSSDDAEEAGIGASSFSIGDVVLVSTDIELSYDTANGMGIQTAGLRFEDIDIPPAASIVDARLIFTAQAPTSGNPPNNSTTTFNIQIQNHPDPPSFSNTPFDISSRTTTSETINWTPANWTEGSTYSSPPINTLVQKIIDRPDWASGNNIVLLTSGSNLGGRTAFSFDENPANAPVLSISYLLP
ncbi:MAG TPA: hypothetical protein ENJ45_05655, partial [Phaeodactylibacter sp.]|nr:hypothetical protein [Phaeodactylibacter sp.]